MTLEAHLALFLVAELLAAWRANDPDTFKCWLAEDAGDQGVLSDAYNVKTQEVVVADNNLYR